MNNIKKIIRKIVYEVLNENLQKNTIDEIINFVKTNSYFDYEGEENDVLQFSTRKNGSVSSETASNKDIIEGKKIKNEILKNFKNVEVKLEIVDEWVLIFISELKEKEEIFKYIFKKDINGTGFQESFNSMDELIKKYGSWIDVDWDEIKTKVENINEFNDNNFNGSFNSRPLLIKKAGDEGNKWGYNFYIVKNKR